MTERVVDISLCCIRGNMVTASLSRVEDVQCHRATCLGRRALDRAL